MSVVVDFFKALLSNHVLVAALLGWLIAQTLKGILYLIKNKEIVWSRFFGSGGMPSSHSSTVTSLVVSIALFGSGVTSPAFAVALIFAIVVVYDAANVRYISGEQSKILNKINDEKDEDNKLFEKNLKEYIGHTKLEVLVGAVLGAAIAVVYWYFVSLH